MYNISVFDVATGLDTVDSRCIFPSSTVCVVGRSIPSTNKTPAVQYVYKNFSFMFDTFKIETRREVILV